MQSLDTIHTYLSSHSEEIGKRILVIVPSPAWRRRSPVSTAFPDGCAFHIQPKPWRSWA